MRTIQNSLSQSRIELYDDGRLACFLQYRMNDGQMWLLSTQMCRGFDDLSLADDLVFRTLQDALRHRLEILPFCPVVRHALIEHPRFLTLIPSSRPGHFPLQWCDGKTRPVRGCKVVTGAPKASTQGWPTDGFARKPKPVQARTEHPRKRALQRAEARQSPSTQPSSSSLDTLNQSVTAGNPAGQVLQPTVPD